ncbi:MAG: MBL fold metallo-hydrolase [Acetobacteraceae bacterium]
MLNRATPETLIFPNPDPPKPGETIEVRPGVFWARFPLPFRLDHVNIYLIADGEGWAVLDCGIGDEACRAVWQAVLAGPLAGARLTRLIVTHYHPDHVGLAGWMCEQYGLGLLMPRSEYLFSFGLQYAPGDLGAENYRRFYRRHGLPDAIAEQVLGRGHHYLRITTGVPATYHRLQAGQTLTLGTRAVSVLTGAGHALEQAMLLDAPSGLFFAADQVIARISPNVSVHAMEPEADALGDYLRSLAALRCEVPAAALVLPGHGLPFFGLHARIAALVRHHAERCAVIAEACRAAPRSAVDLVPIVFQRELDPHQTSFAFGEVLAHVNHMRAAATLAAETDADGRVRFRTL